MTSAPGLSCFVCSPLNPFGRDQHSQVPASAPLPPRHLHCITLQAFPSSASLSISSRVSSLLRMHQTSATGYNYRNLNYGFIIWLQILLTRKEMELENDMLVASDTLPNRQPLRGCVINLNERERTWFAQETTANNCNFGDENKFFCGADGWSN